MNQQNAISQQNKQQQQQSQSIDAMLDYIRDNKLHRIIDFIASYIVMIICIIYYFVSFLNTIHNNKSTSDTTSTNTRTKHGNFVLRLIADFIRHFVSIVSIKTRDTNAPILVPLVTHERTLPFMSQKMERVPTSTLLSYISTLRDEISQIEMEFYDSYNTERNTSRSNEKNKEISLLSPTFIRTDVDCDNKGYDVDGDNDDNISDDSFVVVAEEPSYIKYDELNLVQSNEETDVHDCTSNSATSDIDFDDTTNFILNIRSSLSLRQIATRFVSKYQILLDIEAEFKQRETTESPTQTSVKYETQQRFYIHLKSVWVDLLRFPSLGTLGKNLDLSSDNKHSITYPVASVPKVFDISVIIPAYRERGDKIAFLLYRALQNCDSPTTIQIIIVHADNTCPDLPVFVNESIVIDTSSSTDNDNNKDTQQPRKKISDNAKWGEVRIIQYNNGGGRGPCLNAGANDATGTILTFLHSDTMLPVHWDKKIRIVFLLPTTVNNDKVTHNISQNTPVYHACVFRYGIDTSVSGLDGMKFPWGIRSVTILGRLRSRLCRLPYGDHVISIPASYFHYIGGYPNQPMMEDYDFVDLLRHRSTLHALNEQLYIIPGRPVLCSPRRWQKFGVVYCTGVNAVLVYRYANGTVSPQDIYDYYYNRQPPQSSIITAKVQSDTERKVQ